MKGRIKIGARVYQDMNYGKWPFPFSSRNSVEGEPVDTIFDIKWEYDSWWCRADGYGLHRPEGNYGNGAIAVLNDDGIELIYILQGDQK